MRHGLVEALGSPGGRGSFRKDIKEMLAKLESEISELTRFLTQQRVTKDGVVGSYRRTISGKDYDWLGHQLYPNSFAYCGFKCPGCGAGVYATKRPVGIGQGKRAIVASCHCLVHFTPSVSGRRIAPVTLERWTGFVDWLSKEDPVSSPASPT
jgi:hypothetical protein